MAKSKNEIAKISTNPEDIAEMKPMRCDLLKAQKNHPILTDVTIMGGSYLAGKRIISGVANIINAGTGSYTNNEPAEFGEDVKYGLKQLGSGIVYGLCTLGTLYLLSKDNNASIN